MAGKSPKIYIFLILALALSLRVYGLGWGLPNNSNSFHESLMPDENDIINGILINNPSLKFYFNPNWFLWGTLQFSLTSIVIKAAHFLRIVEFVPIVKYTGDYPYDVYPTVGHFYLNYPLEYGKLFLLGRFIVVFFSILTLCILFLIAKKYYGVSVGLLSALLLSVVPIYLIESHFLKQEVIVTFGILLCAFCGLEILSSDKKRWYALAGCAVGFACAIKYSGITGVIFIYLAHLGRLLSRTPSLLSTTANEIKKNIKIWCSILLSTAIIIIDFIFLVRLFHGVFKFTHQQYVYLRSLNMVKDNQYERIFLFIKCLSQEVLNRITNETLYFYLLIVIFGISVISLIVLIFKIRHSSLMKYIAYLIFDNRLVYFWLSLILTFFILCPFYLVTPIKAIGDIVTLRTIHSNLYELPAIEVGPKTSLLDWLFILSHALGLPLALVSLAAVIFMLVKKDKVSVLFVAFTILVYFLLSFSKSVIILRYLLPVIPFLCIISAKFLVSLYSSVLKKRNICLKFSYLFLCAFIIFYSLAYSFNYSRILGLKDTTIEAAEWIAANIEDNSGVKIGYAMNMDALRMPVDREKFNFSNLDFDIQELERFSPSYLITFHYGSTEIIDKSKRYAGLSKIAAFYDYLAKVKNYEIIKVFKERHVSVFGRKVDSNLSALNLRMIPNPRIVIYKKRG